MGLKILGYRPNRALAGMLQQIEQDFIHHKEIILIVPEHYSLEAQKDILNKIEHRGLFQVEILTPSYLHSRMVEKSLSQFSNLVNPAGESLILARIIKSQNNALGYYRDCLGQRAYTRSLWIFLATLCAMR